MATTIDITPGRRDAPLRDPGREYVVGGLLGAFSASGGLFLANVYDDVVRQFGPRVYDLMECESAVAAALWMLKAAALGDGLKITPKVQADPGEVVSKRKKRSEIKLSAEVYESCERVCDALGQGVIYDTVWQLYGGLTKGCKLAEQVMTLAEEGDDRGRQVPTEFAVKPNWAWAFTVDPYLHVLGYRAWTVDGWRTVAADHFTRFTWMPTEGDPRGSSLLRPCYTPFNAMMQAYPDYGEYLRQFAAPSLILEAGPNMTSEYAQDPVTGVRVAITPQQQMVNAGKEFRNSSILGLPNGAKGTVLQSQGTGQAFLAGFDFFERQIFRSVILSTRPMQEAKHGSKADSESGLDVFSMAVGSVRKPMAGAFRSQFLRRYVELNWGPEVARRHTPACAFGSGDHVAPELMTAFANAWRTGLFEEEQRPYIWGKIGAPVPEGWAPDRAAPRPGTPGQPVQPGPPNPAGPGGTGPGGQGRGRGPEPAAAGGPGENGAGGR